jgi:hypothetical protein
MRAVQVVNTTTGETLAQRAVVADTIWSRVVGLQGRRALPSGEGLVLIPNNSIHMLFMRFPIDAVFVDKAGRVTRIGRACRPWTIGPIAPGALYCVELPAAAAATTYIGHQIELRPL